MIDDSVARLDSSYAFFGDPLYLEARDKIEWLREEIQQLKHDSTIFINERSDAICKSFDLWEENAELRDKIERMLEEIQELKADWRAVMTENHDLWREIERLRAACFWYAEHFCREGFHADCCGTLGDDCRGCLARAALNGEKEIPNGS